MSFASTVVHEMGHWLNDRYGLGNPPSGMGEAVADTLAMFVTGSPSISPGHRRANPDDILRSGYNSRRYCGNKNTNCYQNVGGNLVDDSWPLAGAFWKMRERLVASQGQQQGDLVAMVILNAWQNFFTTTEIKDNIVIRLLNLIDDDNDIRNGTPYYADITRGFADQGWPDKLPGGITFQIPGGVQDMEIVASLDPVSVSIDIEADFYPPLSAAELHYRVDGGAFQVTAPTAVVGDRHTFELPAPAMTPALIEYFYRAQDSSGQWLEHPIQRSAYWDDLPAGAVTQIEDAELQPHTFSGGLLRYYVGEKVVLYANDLCSGCEVDFEALPPQDGGTDPEHTWQFGDPLGTGGTTSEPESAAGIVWTDPDTGFAGGSNAWTTDSFPGGSVDPRHPEVFDSDKPDLLVPQQFLKLRPTTPIQVPEAGDRVVLRFRRWLTVRGGFWNTAQVTAQSFEGSRVLWQNHRAVFHVDNQWRTEDLDLTGTIEDFGCLSWVQWSLVAGDLDASQSPVGEDTLGGWAIDDIEIFELRTLP